MERICSRRPVAPDKTGSYLYKMIHKLLCKSGGVVAAMLLTAALFPLAWKFSTFPGDERAILGVEVFHTDWLINLALAITNLGSFPIAGTLILGAVALLILIRRRTDALVVALTVVPMVGGSFLKAVVDRARPDLFIFGSQPDSMSFPSGHSVYAILFGGILLVLVGDLVESPPIRRTLQIGLCLLILGVGISRVYLGVHWPSDVIGGYLFGGISLLGLVWLRSRLVSLAGQPA